MVEFKPFGGSNISGFEDSSPFTEWEFKKDRTGDAESGSETWENLSFENQGVVICQATSSHYDTDSTAVIDTVSIEGINEDDYEIHTWEEEDDEYRNSRLYISSVICFINTSENFDLYMKASPTGNSGDIMWGIRGYEFE